MKTRTLRIFVYEPLSEGGAHRVTTSDAIDEYVRAWMDRAGQIVAEVDVEVPVREQLGHKD